LRKLLATTIKYRGLPHNNFGLNFDKGTASKNSRKSYKSRNNAETCLTPKYD